MKLHLTLSVEKNVLWFQISVNNSLGMQVLYSQQDFSRVKTATTDT
jgi:hypothetical protein